MENLWAFVIIGGPILLIATIIYGTFRYWRRDRRLDPLAEAEAKHVREEIAEDNPSV